VDRYIKDRRDDWDNISEDWKYWDSGSSSWSDLSEVERKSIESFEDCREACVQKSECLQFKFKRRTCILGANIRVGKPDHDKETPESETTSSGWLLDRIAEYKAGFNSCKVNWDFDQ
jgi:hypothetical protein